MPNANCRAARPELTEPHTKRAPPCRLRRRGSLSVRLFDYLLQPLAASRSASGTEQRVQRSRQVAFGNGANPVTLLAAQPREQELQVYVVIVDTTIRFLFEQHPL